MTKRVYIVSFSNGKTASVHAYNEAEARTEGAEGYSKYWGEVVGAEVDKYHYVPYTLEEMIRESGVSERIKERVRHLVNSHALRIEARNDGGTFVAYAGMRALTYKAVLLVHVVGAAYIAVEKNRIGSDYLAKVVEICTQYSYALKTV